MPTGEPTWTGEIEAACGAPDVALTIVGEYLRNEILVARNLARSAVGDQALRVSVERVYRRMYTAPTVEMDCPFEGDVEAEVIGGTLYWTCPTCGRAHEQDPRP